MTLKGLKYSSLTLAAGVVSLSATIAQADQVISDDLIVESSVCIGFDCVNGESFGFDTLRLKENNLRIHFDDTSNSASFPQNDWRIVANDTGNGGASYLAIEDSTRGRTPFRVDAGAPTNALRVDSSGEVGLGAANPAVELHIADGDSPTIRLEQDGSSGFTPQTYDIAANESNFFIRDVTNGSRLFFRAKPNAPADSLYIDSTGEVGLGTNNPDAALHVKRSGATLSNMILEGASGATKLTVEDKNAAASARGLMELKNNGTVFMTLTDTSGNSWNIQNNSTDFRLTNSVTAGVELTLSETGDLTVLGDINSGGTTNVPDYVFAPDYELMPLAEVEAFIVENSHLPRIPSAADVAANGLNMTDMQMALLEKVEELTLYTLQQQKVIDMLLEERAAASTE